MSLPPFAINILNRVYIHTIPVQKGLASQCKAQEKYKDRLDLGVTWLK